MFKLSKLLPSLAALVFVSLAAPRIEAASISICDAVAGNIVANCGFEAGTFASWTQTGITGFTGVQSPSLNSGDFSAYFGPVGSLGGIQQSIATVAGDLYTMSFFLQSDGKTPNEFQAFFGALVTTGSNLGAFGFTQFTFSGLLAAGASTQIQYLFRNDPGFLLFDDVVVTDQTHPLVPEPATLLLLATGFTGIGARLRGRRKAS